MVICSGSLLSKKCFFHYTSDSEAMFQKKTTDVQSHASYHILSVNYKDKTFPHLFQRDKKKIKQIILLNYSDRGFVVIYKNNIFTYSLFQKQLHCSYART